MNFLRDRGGKIVVGAIGFSLVAFLATEVITSGRSFLRGSANEVGEVNGQKITIEDFNKRVDQQVNQYKQQTGQSSLNPQFTGMIQDNVWNQMLTQDIVQKEIDRLGISVGDAETQDMVSGPNPAPQIAQYFTNPQTGQLDRAALVETLRNMKTAKAGDPRRQEWDAFIDQLINGKKAEKYLALIKNGVYVNSLDAQDDYEAKNRLVNFKYVTADYASVPDAKVTLTDDDYKSYYDEHKNLFKNQQELRSIDYVAFNGAPSKEDSAAVKETVAKLIPDFKASTNDSNFVAINAETKQPLVYQKKGQLEPKVDTVMFNSANGTVYGPYYSNGAYKIAKLVDSRVGPDSVTARHILIPITTDAAAANAKADSLKKLIQSGKKTFAELATTNSVDKNSAVKGGDLGTFARGAMIPVFEDAVFNGKKGDLKIVTSQYGVHLIEIMNQKGSSKVVKVAIVDKPLTPSTKTQTAAYSKAQSFLASLTKDNFDEEAKKEGLTKKTAEDLTGTAGSAGELQSARDLVRWAFNDASLGDFTDKVYTSGDTYVVARLAAIKPKGILSLENVKKQIKPAVLNIAKAKILTQKFEDALKSATTIDQVAQKTGGTVTPVQNIVFANPVIPGTAQENKLVGTIFASQPNKLSKPVEGEKGVYVFVVDNFVNPAALTNTLRQKEQMSQTLSQRAENSILEALKDKAVIKDYRAKML
ncbi:SurA N-terminal domain-containing protein [Mucilaginibacter sp. PPCGB 2223]|uniref:peptidylprolyl isomerase n=1 Tax=Mucilaginibacter sp. PPCGB 2223 TaxID=1886027 RepID=UPI00352B8BE2